MADENPLLKTDGFPEFDKIRPEHIVPAVRRLIATTEKKLEQLEANIRPTWAGLIKPLEEMGLPFEYTWAPVRHLLGVKNSEELRKAYETVLGEMVALRLRLQQSRPIYQGIKALMQGEGGKAQNALQARVVSLKLREAEHAGVGLEGRARERFLETERALSRMGTDFANHVLDATKAFELIITERNDTEGWPESLKKLAAQSYSQSRADRNKKATPEDGPWRITLDYPSFGPFMQHSRRRDQREKIYRVYMTRASGEAWDNTLLIEDILRLRKQKAKLLGFRTYAQLSLTEKMAPDVGAVDEMFARLRDAAQDHATRDLKELAQIAREGEQTSPVAHWDIPFWAERLREKRFDYTEEELRPFFPLPRVLKGLFGLVQQLFDIVIEEAGEGEAPLWHPDVRYYKVYDRAGFQIASFYLDPYSRPHEKRGGAWMDDCLSRRLVDDTLRLPVVHLCCNGTPPVEGRPALMSFTEVKTLFHEFGHGLQGMLTTVDFAELGGIHGVEWDAVELPSQFMENWCYHRSTLSGLTQHIETGESLPDALFNKISAARTFRAGSSMLRQLEFGMTDMELHHRYDPGGGGSALDIHRRISKEVAVLPPCEEDRFLCAFSHIFAGGYAAGYYSYLWAEVLSADAFAAFEEAGLEDPGAVRRLGKRFRDTILALGGSRHPMDVYKDFRGREPTTEALLRHHGLDRK